MSCQFEASETFRMKQYHMTYGFRESLEIRLIDSIERYKDFTRTGLLDDKKWPNRKKRQRESAKAFQF